MDRKLPKNLLARTIWSMYDTVESTVQFCLQKPNVHNSTLLKNTYEGSLIQGAWGTVDRLQWTRYSVHCTLYRV